MQRHGRWRTGDRLAFVSLLALGVGASAHAAMLLPASLDALVGSSAQIVRGRCTAVEPGTVDVAGARVALTTYSFRVTDRLKGARSDTITFRQVGTPQGGPRDLGERVGLPVYEPGTEYVLFLLPESGVGLTSPAGAGDGAFVVSGELVRPVRGGSTAADAMAGAARAVGAETSGDGTVPYEALRRAVLDRVRP